MVGLLKLLRDVCYGTDKKRYIEWVRQAQLRKSIRFSQQPGEFIQKYATNFLEQVKTLEDVHGLLVPTKEMTKQVELTHIVGEGSEEHEETYTETVLLDKDVIASARLLHSFSLQEWTRNGTKMQLMKGIMIFSATARSTQVMFLQW